MWKALVVAGALCAWSIARGSGSEAPFEVIDPAEAIAFAGEVRAVIERGEVGAFIALLAPDVVICGDEPIETSRIVRGLRNRDGFHALLFDTAALKKGPKRTIRRQISYRDFFKLARDAKVDFDERFNMLRWTSESLGDVDEPPTLGVVSVRGVLRIGLISQACM